MPKARLQIWNPANTSKLADIWDLDPSLQQRNFQELETTGYKLNEAGSGGFVLQQDHPAVLAGHIAPLNVVRVYAGNNLVHAYRISRRNKMRVSKRQSQRTLKVEGDGLLADFAEVLVGPWHGGRPNSPDRIWNWASPPLDLTGWSNQLYFQTRTVAPSWPALFPVAPNYAGWVLPRSYALNQPSGDYLMRYRYTLDAAGDVFYCMSADDTFDFWVDGVNIERDNTVPPDTSAWAETYRVVVPHTAGTHDVAILVNNWAVSAGLLFAAFKVNGDKLGDVLFTSHATAAAGWYGYDVSATKPGFTAPQIIQMLITEAQARGAIPGWTVQVHGTHPNIEEFSARVGTPMSEVISSLSEGWCDVEADLQGLKLHVYPKDDLGSASGVTTNVVELEQLDDAKVTTAALGVYADGYRWRTDATAISNYGRKESAVTLGSVTSAAAVDQILDDYLAANKDPVSSFAAKVTDVANAVAGVDYRVGDTVSVDGETLRCVGLSWQVHRNGDLIPYPEFESPVLVRRRELERSIDRQVSSFSSAASAPLLSMRPLIISGRPSYETWNWSWSDDIEDALNEVDPEKPWQVRQAKKTMRLASFKIQCDPDDLADAWGDTTVTIVVNGTELHPLFRVKLTTLIAEASIQIWGYTTISSDDRVQVQCLESGGHVDGTIELIVADAL